MALATGLYGKLPARGDFVRSGLPGSFITAWDDWLQAVLPASQALLGEAWLDAWLEAPIWRFALSEGACGPQAALGLWLPSVDSAGRYFPLALARVGTPAELRRGAAAFLDAAEAAGREAIASDLAPAQVAELLAAAPADDAMLAEPAPWWTAGGPRRAAGTLAVAGLPDGACFASMLDATGPGS